MTDQPPPQNPQKGPKNWVDRLAERSSGLPQSGPQNKPETDRDREETKRLWRFAGLGIQFAGTVGIFWLMGHALDLWQHWNNTAAITLTIIAIIGSMYLLIKEALKANK